MKGFDTWAKRRLLKGDLYSQKENTGTPPAPPSTDAIIQEDGFLMLTEDGDKILME